MLTGTIEKTLKEILTRLEFNPFLNFDIFPISPPMGTAGTAWQVRLHREYAPSLPISIVINPANYESDSEILDSIKAQLIAGIFKHLSS